MSDALRICREEADIDVIVITGAGDKAFCSGGDQNVKGAWRLYRHRWSSPSECAGRTKANPQYPEAGDCHAVNGFAPLVAGTCFMWYVICL